MPINVALSGKYGEGQFAIIDDEDHDLVAGYRWRAHKADRSLTLYARGYHDNEHFLMHRLVMKAEPGTMIDHIDGNGLNNQKANLRVVTHRENVRSGNARRFAERRAAELANPIITK